MHIPDNYLSPATCAAMGAVMIPVWAASIHHVRKDLPKEKIPILGIGAAFSFLIMMLNVPVPGGTTAHAVGGTLIAVLLGPWAATLAVSVALLIQALLFGDGGILAFGANAFNMAFVIPFIGYSIYKFVKDRVKSQSGENIGLAVGSYIGINMAALCAAIEFGLQPALFKDATGLPMYCPYPLSVSIPAMLIPHLTLAGIAEAAFTVAIVAFVKRVAPQVVYEGPRKKTTPLFALVLALIILSPLGLLAPGSAWGEWGANEISKVETGGKALGFVPAGMQRQGGFEALMRDYGVKGLPDVAGYVLSAIAGAAILVIVFKLLGLLRRDEPAKTERAS